MGKNLHLQTLRFEPATSRDVCSGDTESLYIPWVHIVIPKKKKRDKVTHVSSAGSK